MYAYHQNGALYMWMQGEPEMCRLVDAIVHSNALFLQIC